MNKDLYNQFNEVHSALTRTIKKNISTELPQFPEKFTVLYLDDDKQNLISFTSIFRKEYNVITCLNVQEAREELKTQDIHVVLSDQKMPGEVQGVDFLREVKNEYPSISRILVTAYSDITVFEDAINKAAVYKTIRKPWPIDELIKTMKGATPVPVMAQAS